MAIGNSIKVRIITVCSVPKLSMADFDVLHDWQHGRVPHVLPDRPVPVREWPKVSAGPDRLRRLTSMWLSGLPTDSQLALRAFMLLA